MNEVESAAWEFDDDVSAQIDAENDMQSAADARPTSQTTTTKTISASYQGGRSTNTLQQTYTLAEAGSRRLLERQRRLSDDSDMVPSGAATVGDSGDYVPEFTGYEISVATGTGRYDNSKDFISIQFVGTDGTSEYMPLGEFKVKGEEKTIWIESQDGLKLKKITVNGIYEGGMSGMVKCRGSTRSGTYNCEYSGGVSMTVVGADPNDCVAECNPDEQGEPPAVASFAPNFSSSNTDGGEKLSYLFGDVYNSCDVNGPTKFTYTGKCDTGCGDRHGSFKLSPPLAGETIPPLCQQKNGDSYPTYCKVGDEYTQIASSAADCAGTKISHDRGHQIPANNFDNDEDIIEQTNYMTNILPQAAKMNRGAWLKTEMMVECWRNEAPTTVVGGAVYMGDAEARVSHGQSIPAEWEGHDRSDWFDVSHHVKNPTYFWKIIVTAAVPGKYENEDHIAFWMPNDDIATSANANDYIVTIDELEAHLSDWGVPEVFDFPGSDIKYSQVWADPAGCSRA
ncbi:hypothetical protein TeGR_g2812 [Tetraparma gracilis]|uniref:DNA/RNA non-specific endonuclease n=2 Tax=Tetraparma gracilis TaxID=2962635 RepID=A0ABQ6M5H1_9STRA|nr:hypothetical protein TeGR_g2812 [Tetraparma gracilis]